MMRTICKSIVTGCALWVYAVLGVQTANAVVMSTDFKNNATSGHSAKSKS